MQRDTVAIINLFCISIRSLGTHSQPDDVNGSLLIFSNSIVEGGFEKQSSAKNFVDVFLRCEHFCLSEINLMQYQILTVREHRKNLNSLWGFFVFFRRWVI
jgi:hypothetical protein